MTTRYFVEREKDGSVSLLARIKQDDSGLWGEYLDGGQWVEHHSMTNFLVDPLAGDPISEAEAAQIARDMGGTLD